MPVIKLTNSVKIHGDSIATFIDSGNKLYSSYKIPSNPITYTATQNCYVFGWGNYYMNVYIDGIQVTDRYAANTWSFPLMKDQVLRVSNDYPNEYASRMVIFGLK